MNKDQKKLLEFARSLIGTPYKYAAKPEEIPMALDCSSFTQTVFSKIEVRLERSTLLQATQGKEVLAFEQAQPGDLLFFRGSKGHYNDELFPGKEMYIGHVAIYLGGTQAIHASSPQGVIEEDVNSIIKTRGPIVLIKRML